MGFDSPWVHMSNLPSFPVNDFVLDQIEHALGGALNENGQWTGSDFSLPQYLDFLSGHNESKYLSEALEGGTEVRTYCGEHYHYTDVILALIGEIRRLRSVAEVDTDE